MKNDLAKLLNLVDPYKQSAFYFKMSIADWAIFLAACVILFLNRNNIFCLLFLLNPLFSFPNLFVHAFFGHGFLGPIMAICASAFLPNDVTSFLHPILLAASGNLSEMTGPIIGIFICLQIGGGRYILPIPLYGLSVALFNWGLYITDYSTQDDAFAYNKIIGDWAFILEQLGLSDYAALIGNVIIFGAIVLFVLTIWSIFYYIKHMDQYPIPYSATH